MNDKLEYYEELCSKFDTSVKSKKFLEIQDWFYNIEKSIPDNYVGIFEYDLDGFLDYFINRKKEVIYKDDILTKIIEKSKNTIYYIIRNMTTKIITEDVIVNIYDIKKINNKGIAWISRKPGRNLRQKISMERKMLCPKKRMSFDTSENRLFLEFLRRLNYYLTIRLENIPDKYNDSALLEFKNIICDFLSSNITKEIGVWNNLPPNNRLLSDKYYRVIWNSWNDLIEINNSLKELLEDYERILGMYNKFQETLKLKEKGGKFVQTILKVDVNKFILEVDLLCYNLNRISKVNSNNKYVKNKKQKKHFKNK